MMHHVYTDAGTNKWDPMNACLASGTTKESKTNRPVSFSETADKTYNVLALDDYTAEEIARTWRNLDELVVIAHENRTLIQKLENNEDIDTRQYCIRGLEGMAGARKDRITNNRGKAYDAVLHFKQEVAQLEDGRDEQELIAQERDDQESIADLYRVVSADCSIEAAEMGLSDEHDVHTDYIVVAETTCSSVKDMTI
jgi:hypothetical protein